MCKTRHLLLLSVVVLLFGHNHALADTETTLSKPQFKRYGLEHVKLGFPVQSLKHLNSSLNTILDCTNKRVALGEIKRVFIHTSCTLPKKHTDIALWGEPLQLLNISFLDNKLITLSIEFKTPKDHSSIYKKHRKHLLKLLGQASSVNKSRIIWRRESDEAILTDKEKGVVKLIITNKKLNDHLSPKKEQ